MSRAEKKPIEVPANVAVEVNGATVVVRGSGGELSFTFCENVLLFMEEGRLRLRANGNSRQARAMVGTARAIVANMIVGVTRGFSKQLEISGVGFKAAQKNAGVLELSLGASHPIFYSLPLGVRVAISDGVRLTVEGADRLKVGQAAADIFSFYPMEPYKGKGVRIVGKFVRRKEGKKSA
ncbi:MAG: 50S ribosomal protein L6 [Puniceicoccales bacterium]|jgi:large subunit ribosomal protein L6|nr:50S ribosomal protein L6 [Puniceicoccales bacterium]